MARYLLDTNIISNLFQPAPSPSLVAWMDERRDHELFISAMTPAEIRVGILTRTAGRKRSALEEWFVGPDGPQALFAGRILGFDEHAALIWADLMATGRNAGHPRDAIDTIIAAAAILHNCIVVTDNERHFPDIGVLNPLRLAR